MSVLKNLRNLSSMEYYKNAIQIRKNISTWLLKDFGVKRNPRSVTQVIKNIESDDQAVIDEIFSKYGKHPQEQFESIYPEWFVEHERTIIIKLLQTMIENITRANSIYAVHECEFDLRRVYQDKAIGTCYVLYQELQYIVSMFNTDLNKFVRILDSIETEVDLLKGWRQSDNRKRKQIKEKQK